MKSWISLASLWVLAPAISYAGCSFDLREVLTADDVQFSAETVVAFPNDTQFFQATQRRDRFGAPTFGASITPATEQDVSLAVKLAVENDIPFLATGARHGSGLGYSAMRGGIAIDLSAFKMFEAHVNDSTATIGGAASIYEFGSKLSAAGLMLPSGSCACPGFTGLAVGGGIGRYMGFLGIISDRMISARVVNATGDIINVSADENADLFWGLRGAGANFGIILSSTYQAAKKSDHSDGYVLTVDLVFSADKVPAYLEYIANLGPELKRNVGGLHLISYNPNDGRPQLYANWVWFGPEDEGHEFIAQFIEFEPYSVSNYEYIQSSRLIAVSGGGSGERESCVPDIYTNTYSSNLKTYSYSLFQEVFDRMDDFYATYPEARDTSVNLSLFPNQAVMEKDHDFNAYAWRETNCFISVSAIYTESGLQNSTLLEAGDQLGAGVRDLCTEQGGFREHGGAIYVNYSRGDESLETVFGDKLPRLVELKKKYDPDNVFRFKNALPTSYP